MFSNIPFLSYFSIQLLVYCFFSVECKSQNNTNAVPRYEIGIVSTPAGSEVKLRLSARIQSYNLNPVHDDDIYDSTVNSPKSVNFSSDGKKFYIHSLEGYSTSVYNTASLNPIKIIHHIFSPEDSALFVRNEHTIFDYKYRDSYSNFNIFKGKPVESCFSHNGKYLWVTYYRRDFDINAECPSAIAIIDTETDSIVRVMPSGPLPKMIACSPDNKYIAVTHWGDNTVGIIDISSNLVSDFFYVSHLIIDYRGKLDFGNEPVNRDQQCGHCLRGTVFSPGSDYLLIGKMGGTGGIAVFSVPSFDYLGTLTGSKSNLRHMIISGDYLFISTNNSGFVQKAPIMDIIQFKTGSTEITTRYDAWQNCFAGYGVRTIDVTHDGQYIFACINNESRIGVIRSSDMKLISTVKADAYPVGLCLSPDNTKLVVTSQGKSDKGGNSVMLYDVDYFR
jgi:DNA-binding beta-propeller fold protein YncE